MAEYDTAFSPPSRGPGRPRGSKTRSEASKTTERKLNQTYARLRPMLTEDQRQYFDDCFSGKRAIDAEMELELVIKQATLAFSAMADQAWDTGKMPREFPDVMNALRMSIKDLEDIRKARAEDKTKAHLAEQQNDVDQEKLKTHIDSLVEAAMKKIEATDLENVRKIG